jgi:hypothetical protein
MMIARLVKLFIIRQNAVSELSQMKIEFDEINHKYKLEMEAK